MMRWAGRVARKGFSVQTLRKGTARRTRFRGDDNVKNYPKYLEGRSWNLFIWPTKVPLWIW